MVEVIQTSVFQKWLAGLRDRQARAGILRRVTRLEAGNPGDVAPVGEGISEMRVHTGAGYRMYYLQRGPVLVVLLCGGDKSTQQADIAEAKLIAQQWSQ